MPTGNENDQEQTAAYLQWPAHVPSPGTRSTYGVNSSLQPYNILCQTICLTLVTGLVLLRIYTKGRVLKILGLDDFASVVAWIGLIVFGCLLFQQDRHGAGKHLWAIKEQDYVEFIRWIKVGEVVYVLAMLFTKVSILLLYLRIFRPSRAMRIVIHVNLWINVAVYIIGFGAGISWFIGPKATGEVSGRVLGLASAIFNSVSDIAILLIPISMVWTLKMARERKLAISAVFTTGILGCVASSVRMALYVKHLKGYDDPTWQTYPEQLWSYTEISAGILCGCMPAVPGFWKHLRERFGKKQTGRAPNNLHGPQDEKEMAIYRPGATRNEP